MGVLCPHTLRPLHSGRWLGTNQRGIPPSLPGLASTLGASTDYVRHLPGGTKWAVDGILRGHRFHSRQRICRPGDRYRNLWPERMAVRGSAAIRPTSHVDAALLRPALFGRRPAIDRGPLRDTSHRRNLPPCSLAELALAPDLYRVAAIQYSTSSPPAIVIQARSSAEFASWGIAST